MKNFFIGTFILFASLQLANANQIRSTSATVIGKGRNDYRACDQAFYQAEQKVQLACKADGGVVIHESYSECRYFTIINIVNADFICSKDK